MERKNGETFEFEGKKLKVVDNNDNSGCEKCFFCNRECSSIRDVRGFCSEDLRTDKKHVIFVEAKDEQPQQAEQPQETEEIKERKVGEVFEYEGKKLKVVKAEIRCGNCFFYKNSGCTRINRTTGECKSSKRSDNESVVFVEITEEQAEQPQKLNLCEILRDCPKGTKLYSTVLGYVIFQGIVEGVAYPIVVSCENGVTETFTADGKMFVDFGGECTLFPSKEQRSWAGFIAPWLKKERFDPKTFKAFDRVLAMNSSTWHCATFSHLRNTKSEFVYDCGGIYFRYCIPYNDDTKHLVGTKDEAPEYYRYWED